MDKNNEALNKDGKGQKLNKFFYEFWKYSENMLQKQRKPINSNRDETFKSAYNKIMGNEKQKLIPFGLTEKRFTINLPFLCRKDVTTILKERKRKKKERVDGGLNKFINRPGNGLGQFSNNPNENRIKYRGRNKSQDFKNSFSSTSRVILPDKEYENKKLSIRRTYYGPQQFLRPTKSSYELFMNKTPKDIIVKGKRHLNRSVDLHIKPDCELFSENFLNDKNYNRIFGVDRKHLIHKVNLETSPLSPLDYGRKHFTKGYLKTFIF